MAFAEATWSQSARSVESSYQYETASYLAGKGGRTQNDVGLSTLSLNDIGGVEIALDDPHGWVPGLYEVCLAVVPYQSGDFVSWVGIDYGISD